MTQTRTHASGRDNPSATREDTPGNRPSVPLPVFRGVPADREEPPAMRAERAQPQPVFSSAPLPRQPR